MSLFVGNCWMRAMISSLTVAIAPIFLKTTSSAIQRISIQSLTFSQPRRGHFHLKRVECGWFELTRVHVYSCERVINIALPSAQSVANLLFTNLEHFLIFSLNMLLNIELFLYSTSRILSARLLLTHIMAHSPATQTITKTAPPMMTQRPHEGMPHADRNANASMESSLN